MKRNKRDACRHLRHHHNWSRQHNQSVSGHEVNYEQSTPSNEALQCVPRGERGPAVRLELMHTLQCNWSSDRTNRLIMIGSSRSLTESVLLTRYPYGGWNQLWTPHRLLVFTWLVSTRPYSGPVHCFRLTYYYRKATFVARRVVIAARCSLLVDSPKRG
ncbi:hypothetical protein LX36DRAFT_202277 [Colletotrichum falcatum]|nr:hypothetical protein LX36DRAFT_202277 [Colletotrichum falcatum]